MEFRQRFQEYLDNMPKTVWGMVALLSSKKIKGIPTRVDICPLAVLFKTEFPGHIFSTGLFRVEEYTLGGYQSWALPKAASDFVDLFDNGKLPAFRS